MNHLRTQAEALREQGYSYGLIKQRLGISKSTLSYWFRDKPFTPNAEVVERIRSGPSRVGLRRHNRRVEETAKVRQAGIDELGLLSKRDLWLLGIGIYLGEGAKTTEGIRISNADPNVIRIAMRWLREVCNLDDSNFAIRIHAYPDSDVDECIRFWLRVTGLSADNLRKIMIDGRTGKTVARKRKLPYGTLHVTVIAKGDPEKGVRLFRRINGWMTGAMNQV